MEGIELLTRFLLWGSIYTGASGVWLMLGRRGRNTWTLALALSISAAGLSGVVCGLADAPLKLLAYAAGMTPLYLVLLLWLVPAFKRRRSTR